jgi:hypothetical protein
MKNMITREEFHKQKAKKDKEQTFIEMNELRQ